VIAIIIPVLGREDRIEPLLENIAQVTDVEHRVVFVCSRGDPATEVCRATDADTIVVPWAADRADYAKKINRAFELTEEEWIFQAATDLLFHEKWASRALYVGNVQKVGVVGTNDLGNPSVKRGAHATHILISRAYIETYGGTVDNSGIVFSTEYDHQYIDTEFVQTAVARRQFAPCLRSVVEHLHPHWGKAEMDATYEKSERLYREDAAIYNRRMREVFRIYPRRRGPRR
jgi:glycosyltransferase involved in cell wall biosynthesis